MLTDEQKSRLDPEQLAIAEQWDIEREMRIKQADKLFQHIKDKDITEDEYLELVQEMTDNEPDRCAHDRSMMGTCASCDKIERLLWPEMYCKVCEEHGSQYMNPLNEDGICEYCAEE